MPSNLERKASRRKKQTRLTFEPIPEQDASLSPAPKMSPAKVRYQTRGNSLTVQTKPKMKLGPSVPTVTLQDSDDEPCVSFRGYGPGNADDYDATPRRTQQGMFSSSKAKKAGYDDSDNNSDYASDDSEPVVKSASKRRQPIQTVQIDSSSDELGHPDSEPVSATITRRIKRGIPDVEANLSDEDPIITSSAIRQPEKLTTILDDDSDEEEDEESIVTRKRVRRQVEQSDDSDADSDSGLKRSPTKRRQTQQVGTTTNSTKRIVRDTQKKRHRTQKEKDLELMKLRRAGNKNATLPESSTDEDDDESEQELDHLSEFEDEEVEDKVSPRAAKSKRQSAANDEDDEDQFIIDDEDENVGIPGEMDGGIPIEFTPHYNKPEKEHFRDIIESFVHKELNPTFTEKKDIFKRAFQKLDKKPEALRNSEYKSSQWTPEFVIALEARPNYVETGVALGDDFGEGRCEPCNRSKHPPKYAISFTGRAYNRETLEEIEQDDCDESDGDGSVDGLGRHIASEDRQFLTGRFCRAKAQKAHLLTHWQFHLYEWVRQELDNEPELEPANVLKHRKLKPWEKRNKVEAVVQRWEDNGKLNGLYRDYKESVSKLGEVTDKSARWE